MDSHEARALLRSSPWPGYSQDEQQAQAILICDIHEWLERLIRRGEQRVVCEDGVATYYDADGEVAERGETVPTAEVMAELAERERELSGPFNSGGRD